MELGFIGIGRMGIGMAPRLLDGGHQLVVHDVSRAACEPLLARGARWAATPADAARASEILFTCVPGPKEVAAVIEGPDGVLSAPRKGAMLVEMSTIGPKQSQQLAARCREAGLAYIDAPVSNGVGPAARGELTIMVGGSPADYERALPVLKLMGNRIYRMGDTGAGNIAKIANQMIYLSYVAAFCETARMAREAGLDVPNLVDVMRNSVSGDPLMTGWEKRLENGDRVAGFKVRRVIKDLELGEAVCRERGFEAPVFDAVLGAYRQAAEAGHAELDMTAVFSA